MSVQLTLEQETAVAQIAEVTERTTDELAQEAVDKFLHTQREHQAAIERSRAQIVAGQTLSHEEVFSNLKKRMGW